MLASNCLASESVSAESCERGKKSAGIVSSVCGSENKRLHIAAENSTGTKRFRHHFPEPCNEFRAIHALLFWCVFAPFRPVFRCSAENTVGAPDCTSATHLDCSNPASSNVPLFEPIESLPFVPEKHGLRGPTRLCRLPCRRHFGPMARRWILRGLGASGFQCRFGDRIILPDLRTTQSHWLPRPNRPCLSEISDDPFRCHLFTPTKEFFHVNVLR